MAASPAHGDPVTETAIAKPPETDCGSITDSALRAAITEGHSRLEAQWLKAGDGYITRYAIAGEDVNPLLPQRQTEAGSVPISGFAYAGVFNCALLLSDDGSKALLKFSADAVRFNEADAGWTQPIAKGTVLVLLAGKQGDAWTLEPRQGDETIFPPGTQLSRPDPGNLPPHAAWPVKECRMPKLWSGTKCVRPKS